MTASAGASRSVLNGICDVFIVLTVYPKPPFLSIELFAVDKTFFGDDVSEHSVMVAERDFVEYLHFIAPAD